MELVELKSVSSFVNKETKMVYQKLQNGTPDLENGVSLTEDQVPGEWLDGLSQEDLAVVMGLVDYL